MTFAFYIRGLREYYCLTEERLSRRNNVKQIDLPGGRAVLRMIN
jgi:hypothetical protein